MSFLHKSKGLQPLVQNRQVRSQTVITVKAGSEVIAKLKAAARRKGFLLGEGYGDLKKETFRIANFPALHKKEIHRLMKFLKDY